jgi:mRNA-degrading endonuclease toxin of MazEF toxin-antitoxin module
MIDTIQTTPKNSLEVPIESITRSKVKKLKDAFNEFL